MWCTSGFENDTLDGLIKATAKWHVENHENFKDDKYIGICTPLGDSEATAEEVAEFNEAVRDEMNRLKELPEMDCYEPENPPTGGF